MGDDPDGRLARLIRDGSIRQGRAAAPRALFIDQPPLPKPGSSAVEALLEERREGRCDSGMPRPSCRCWLPRPRRRACRFWRPRIPQCSCGGAPKSNALPPWPAWNATRRSMQIRSWPHFPGSATSRRPGTRSIPAMRSEKRRHGSFVCTRCVPPMRISPQPRRSICSGRGTADVIGTHRLG